MRKTALALLAGASLFTSGSVFAQTTTIETTGAAPPDEVVTYVQREKTPSVRIEGNVAVGSVLPGTVELHTVPSHKDYSYAVVNERRVIVEPKTRKIIRVIE